MAGMAHKRKAPESNRGIPGLKRAFDSDTPLSTALPYRTHPPSHCPVHTTSAQPVSSIPASVQATR